MERVNEYVTSEEIESWVVALDPHPHCTPLLFHMLPASCKGSICWVSASITSHVGSSCCTQVPPGQEQGREGGKGRRTSGPGDRDCCKELCGQEIIPNPNLNLLLQRALSCSLKQEKPKSFHIPDHERTTYEAKTNNKSFASLLQWHSEQEHLAAWPVSPTHAASSKADSQLAGNQWEKWYSLKEGKKYHRQKAEKY